MREKLPFSKQLAYALGQLGWATLINILGLNLVYYYIESTPPLITQTIFLFIFNAIALLAAYGRILESIVDPIIAGLSDKSKLRLGRRIPFMALGILPACFACWLTFIPPDAHSSALNLIWLIVMQTVFFLSFGLYVMPHNALLIELGHTSKMRLNLSTYISVAYAIAIILASLAPNLAEIFTQIDPSLSAKTAFRYGVGALCLFSGFCMLVPVLTIKESRYCDSKPSTQPVWTSLRETFKNKRFQKFVFSDCAYWAGESIIETGLLFYITILAHKPATFTPTLLALMLGVSLLVYPLVNSLAQRFGRKFLIQCAFGGLCIPFGIIYFLGNIPINDDIMVVILGVLAGLPMAFLGILPNTILADISELDALQTGINKEGMFFAARTTFMKLGQTFGILIFAMLLSFGKDANNDFGIRLSGIAGLILCIAALIIFKGYNEKLTLKEIANLQGEQTLRNVKT